MHKAFFSALFLTMLFGFVACNEQISPELKKTNVGVVDGLELCEEPDGISTSIDGDGDCVPDSIDLCPNTPLDSLELGIEVDANGCTDIDEDGVFDDFDHCDAIEDKESATGEILITKYANLNTPEGFDPSTELTSYPGCFDIDGDGVPDSVDFCDQIAFKIIPTSQSNTPTTSTPLNDAEYAIYSVDFIEDFIDGSDLSSLIISGVAMGCADIDADGVPDSIDQCDIQANKTDINGASSVVKITNSNTPSASFELDIMQENGCSDVDEDGVDDSVDRCDSILKEIADYPLVFTTLSNYDTPSGADVIAVPTLPASLDTITPTTYQGCSDSDDDGAWDGIDQCPDTPQNTVDSVFLSSSMLGTCLEPLEENNPPGCGCFDSDQDGYVDQDDQCPYEEHGDIVTWPDISANVNDQGCLLSMEVTLVNGNGSTRFIHKAGVPFTSSATIEPINQRCLLAPGTLNDTTEIMELTAGDIPGDMNRNILCWVEANELELKQNGFGLQLSVDQGLCDHVYYDPYFFYQYDPGPKNFMDRYVTATVENLSGTNYNINYLAKRFDYSFGSASPTSCSTCVVPRESNGLKAILRRTASTYTNTMDFPNNNFTINSDEYWFEECQEDADIDTSPAGTYCSYNHEASDGPNCDTSYIGEVTYYMDHEWNDEIEAPLVPGATEEAEIDYVRYADSASTVGSDARNATAAGCSSCLNEDGSFDCPETNNGPEVSGYLGYAGAVADAAVEDAIVDPEDPENLCGFNYDLNGSTRLCDTGSVNVRNVWYVNNGSGSCELQVSGSSQISCGGEQDNCGLCVPVNTASGTPNVDLDANPLTNNDKPWRLEVSPCGGNRNNCIQGPGTDFVNTQGRPIGTIAAASAGFNNSWQYTIDPEYKSNMFLANYLSFTRFNGGSAETNYNCGGGTHRIEDYDMSQLMSYVSAASTATVSGPFKETNPFYAFYCLDSSYEVKGLIRVQVRDWDRSVYPPGQAEPSATASAFTTDADSPTGVGTPAGVRMDTRDWENFLGMRHNQYRDWDDQIELDLGGSIGEGAPSCADPTSSYPFPAGEL